MSKDCQPHIPQIVLFIPKRFPRACWVFWRGRGIRRGHHATSSGKQPQTRFKTTRFSLSFVFTTPSKLWPYPQCLWSKHVPWPQVFSALGSIVLSQGFQVSLYSPRIFKTAAPWRLFCSKMTSASSLTFLNLSEEAVGQASPGHLVHFMLTLKLFRLCQQVLLSCFVFSMLLFCHETFISLMCSPAS